MHPKTKSIEDCHNLAAAKGGKCLSTNYINSGTYYIWECSVGHQWEAKYKDVQQGTWCPKCGIQHRIFLSRNSLEDCSNLALKNNGKCLSVDYVNNKTKLLWECEFGHRWEASYDNILRETWCPTCSPQKKKQTMMRLYGVAHPLQNKDIQDKAAKSSNNSGTIIHWKTGESCVWIASYERKTINYFNDNKINFLWQPKVFIMPDGKTYRPDLYLVNEDLWIEIKGRWYNDAFQKWQWFHEKLPNSEVWDKKKLKELGIL